jgi:hypothetical protein
LEEADMTTIVIDGVPVTATEVVCDRLPGNSSAGATRLKVAFDRFKPEHIDGTVPIVFPIGDDLYRGEFQVVAKDDPPGSGMYIFITDGDIRRWL